MSIPGALLLDGLNDDGRPGTILCVQPHDEVRRKPHAHRVALVPVLLRHGSAACAVLVGCRDDTAGVIADADPDGCLPRGLCVAQFLLPRLFDLGALAHLVLP